MELEKKSVKNSPVEPLVIIRFQNDVSNENKDAIIRVIYFVRHELKNSPEDQRKVTKYLMNELAGIISSDGFEGQSLP